LRTCDYPDLRGAVEYKTSACTRPLATGRATGRDNRDVGISPITPISELLDNYGTHGHPNVRAWLEKHPRFHLHFTPTSSSWLNLVERWFRNLTEKAIRRGVFRNVPDLVAAIDDYLEAHNIDPKPFIWTATAEQILEKVRRGRVTLKTITG